MPTSGELVDAVATILVVVATHLRSTQHRRRLSERCARELREVRHELAALQDRFARWSGLP